MKLNEFKAWFEGYTESMEGAPSKKQWERIKEQVAAIDGVAVTQYSYPVYIDRYVRPQYPYWGVVSQVGHGVCNNLSSTSLTGQAQTSTAYVGALMSAGQNAQTFDGVSAMYAAGKAESLNS